MLAVAASGGQAAVPSAESPALHRERVAAVAAAKAGALATGIAQLERLHRDNPGASYVTADLIVLLRVAGRNERIAVLTQRLDPDALPDYALPAWAGALRDERLFARARAVLAGRATRLGPSVQVLYAMITLEDGAPKAAVRLLPDPRARGLGAEDLADMAYVLRRAGDPAGSLSLSEQALMRGGAVPQALREEVFALSDLGAAGLAWDKARQHEALFSPEFRDRLRADATASRIRDARRERRRLDDLHRYGARNGPLIAVLRRIDADRVAFAHDPAQELRTRYERIAVLRDLGRMPEAVADFESLPQHPATASAATLRAIPPYVRQAAADAYAAVRRPHRAVALYEGLIQENPKADLAVFLSLYYAYLDCEQYASAERLLAHVRKITPTWIGLHNQDVNPERPDIERIWAMDPAYRNREPIAYQRMRALTDRAPASANLLNQQATLERRRGWPEQAQRTAQVAEGYDPGNKDTLLNLADDNRDLGRYAIWGAAITSLYQDFPDDTSIRKSMAQWTDRSEPSITSDYLIGNASGGSALVASREEELHTRLNSPWSSSGWRAFADQNYIWAQYPGAIASFNRAGVGVQWAGERRQASLMASQDQLTGHHPGIDADWSQWLSDQWEYSVSGSTYSLEMPVLAKTAGDSGKSISARVDWRQSESRSAYASATVVAISDGNRQVDTAVGMTQRIYGSAHAITTAGFDLATQNNSRQDSVYFDPTFFDSAEIRLEHQWITWRRYERLFTQDFRLLAGSTWEAGFGAAPTYDLRYEHQWQLSRTWSLQYGAGLNSTVYEGGRQRLVYGLLGFGGVF